MCIRDRLAAARRADDQFGAEEEWLDFVGERVERRVERMGAVSYTHLRAHETVLDLVCRLLLEKKKP